MKIQSFVAVVTIVLLTTSTAFGYVGAADAANISGIYEIKVKANDQFLGEAARGDKLISTRSQQCSDYARFSLERQSDGSYRVKVVGSNRYWHVDSSTDRFLSTRYQVSDAHTHFFFERQSDDSYRIRLKATGRYLHEDGSNDKIISTRYQVTDNHTRFYLVRNYSVKKSRSVKDAAGNTVLNYNYLRPINTDCSVPQEVKDADVFGTVQVYIDLFDPACAEHDLNYQAPWRIAGFDGYRGKAISDAKFKQHMYTICDNKVDDLLGLANMNCKRMADVWYLAVSQTPQGKQAFDRGQSRVDCTVQVE